jgi:hypothetical protein
MLADCLHAFRASHEVARATHHALPSLFSLGLPPERFRSAGWRRRLRLRFQSPSHRGVPPDHPAIVHLIDPAAMVSIPFLTGPAPHSRTLLICWVAQAVSPAVSIPFPSGACVRTPEIERLQALAASVSIPFSTGASVREREVPRPKNKLLAITNASRDCFSQHPNGSIQVYCEVTGTHGSRTRSH